ncbi:hypothetical protein TSOC_010747, partial [Tetrabaena socialis]
TCPDVPGYTFLKPYYDLLGFDISCSVVGARTVNDLGSQCSITPACKLFNLFVRDGQIQSCNKKFPGTADTPILGLLVSQQTTLMPQPCMGVYISNTAIPCPNVPGFTFSQYYDLPGHDLSCSPVGTTTMMDLGLQCSITPGCKLFNL